MSRRTILSLTVALATLAFGAVVLLLIDESPQAPVDASWVTRPEGIADTPPSTPEPPPKPRPERVASERTPEVLAMLPRNGPAEVIGRVTDAETGQPLSTFSVDILAAESPAEGQDAEAAALQRVLDQRHKSGRAFRSSVGIFRWIRPPGRYDVVVRAPGYAAGVVTGYLLPALDYEPIEFRLVARPGITGLLRDEFGDPVRQADVYLKVEELHAGDRQPPMNTARTDAEGRFRFWNLPPGRYGVSPLELSNPLDAVGGLLVTDGSVSIEIDLAPRPHLMVHVRDPVGRRVVGAQVELIPMGAAGSRTDGRTGVDGLVIMRHILPGDYDVLVTRDGFAEAREVLELRLGSSRLERWITLAPTTGG